ncbi:hypothetical protein CP8484711_1262A, partial [Chlamydia psittaci 84-8471/1]
MIFSERNSSLPNPAIIAALSVHNLEEGKYKGKSRVFFNKLWKYLLFATPP